MKAVSLYWGNRVVFVEPDPSYDYEEDLRQADAVLKQVIQRGLFVIEERREFDFLAHGSSAQELLAFWGENGQGMSLEQAVANALEED